MSETLHVASIRCENFKRWTLQSVRPMGSHVSITGKNAAGKTSLLETVWVAMGGKPSKDIPEPIHKGQDRAILELDLQDASGQIIWKVKRTFASKDGKLKESLELRRADGSRQPQPQTTLDALCLPICFSPSEWIRKKPQEQLDDVLRIYGVKPPVAAVERITGEKIPAKENESAAAYLNRLSADETGLFYVRRREANRQLIQKEKAFDEFRPALQEDYIVEKDEDISSLLEEQKELYAKRESIRQAKAKANEINSARNDCKLKLDRLAADLKSSHDRIEELKRQLAEEMAKAKELESRVSKGQNVLKQWDEDLAKSLAAVDDMTDPTPRLQEIDALIQTANKNQEALAEKRQARETAKRLKEEADECREEHANLDRIVNELRAERRHILDGLDLGVEGLAVGDGELRLGDAPFVQASRAQQTLLACDLLFMQNPKFKFLILDDAEKLDKETEAVLRERANKRGWQIWSAIVDRDASEIDIAIIEADYAQAA